VQYNISAMRVGNDMISVDVVDCFKDRDLLCERIAANAALGFKIVARPSEYILLISDMYPASSRRLSHQKIRVQFAAEIAAQQPPGRRLVRKRAVDEQNCFARKFVKSFWSGDTFWKAVAASQFSLQYGFLRLHCRPVRFLPS